MDSDDDIEMESEIAEMLAFETDALASLRAGDPELAVLNADGTLRCPLCSPSKKKQSYAYQDPLQHATAVSVGIRGPEAAGKHSALKLYLESDLASMAPPPVLRARQKQDEMFPRKRPADDKLLCPWSVVVYNGASGRDEDGQAYFGKNEIKAHFVEFKPDKVHMIWGPRGHLGFSILQFGKGFEGLNDALALEKSFMDEHHGRRDYEKSSAAREIGQGFYGWLAREEDRNERLGSEVAAVAQHFNTYGDLKDIGMVGNEIKKINDLQLNQLGVLLAEKDKESINLKTELEVMKRKAEADRMQIEESLKLGTWTACQIL